MKQLLLGCGSRKEKTLYLIGENPEWEGELVTLDMEPNHHPDVVWNLEERPLPFADNEFDRIHCYDVLEHIGTQGDWVKFFEEWGEYWRILKNGGMFLGQVPHWSSEGAWGDPSHTRVLTPMTFAFLSQKEYQNQVGVTKMSDLRSHWDKDFITIWRHLDPAESFSFILQAVK